MVYNVNMSKVHEFLKQNKMLAGSFDKNEIERKFLLDMQEENTLCMFKTYLKTSSLEIPKEKILVIDAGGTNLRFTVFENAQIVSEKSMQMFGVGQEITADEFFECMAKEIEKYDCQRIGFCFSYPAKTLPNNDAEIFWFTKEVKITGAEGKVLGEEINKRLKDKKQFVILNDTVACQLSMDADIGMILGTGFNMCYTDKNLGMIVNPECGQYSNLPCGTFDEMLNEELNSPRPCAEKQISGVYLEKLIQITAREYFKKQLPSFELKDVSDFLNEEGIIFDYFSSDERKEFKEIVDELLTRAAERIGTMVKCLSLGCYDVSIAIEGSTVYKLPGYLDKVKSAIKSIPGIYFTFKDARGGISIGTAKALDAK